MRFRADRNSAPPWRAPSSRARASCWRDEPTGALDSRATDELLRLFGAVNRMGQTILMVTHSVKAASHAGRVLFIKDGEVFHQIYRGQLDRRGIVSEDLRNAHHARDRR